MKLYRTIIMWDVFVVANDGTAAREAVKLWIEQEHLPPTEETALESKSDNNIRESWQEQKPIVASDISDADFEKLRGKTTLDIFNLIYKKQKLIKQG